VLSLPLLVFIAALMINYGAAANWKLRALVVARQQLWGSRLVPYVALNGGSVQPDYTQPVPAFWTAAGGTFPAATVGVKTTDITNVEQQANLGPGSGTTSATPGQVVRGSQLGAFVFSDIPAMGINAGDILNPANGGLARASQISGTFPYFNRWAGYTWNPQGSLLNNSWPFWDPQMTWTDSSRQNTKNLAMTGLNNNIDQRVPIIYTEPPASSTAYAAARSAVLTFYNYPNTPSAAVTLLDSLIPDFNDGWLPPASGWAYPYVSNSWGCQLDYGTVSTSVQTYIKNLPALIKQQIQNDINYYNYQIAMDQAALNSTNPPPTDPQALQTQISTDQGIVSELQGIMQALGQLSL
jgi:hypothetical protein